MNKIAKLSILAVALVSSMTSCIEETLPTYVITSDQAASSDVALEGMVGAIATSLTQVGGVYSGDYHFDFSYPALMLANDALAGEFVPTSSDDVAGYDWFSSWSTNQYTGPLYVGPNFYWVNYYTYIKAANDVISTLTTGEELSVEQMQYMAIAKAFRASFYLDMARHYDPFANDYTDVSAVEDLTVPYISEATTESEARNNPRLTRDDMFVKIFEDLDAAETIYNTEGVSQPTGGVNPDMAVVYGLKARAYMWLGGFDSANYALAAEYARKAIDLSGAITSGADWTSTTNGFNTKIYSWMWYVPQSSNSISNLINFTAWTSPEASWGYDAMICYGLRNVDYDRMGSNDIRKSIVIGASVNYDNYKDVTLATESEFSGFYPYTNLKFRPMGGVTNDYTSGGATNIPLMRVEEMYFIEAEATAHTSGDAAGLSLLASIMSYRDSDYSTTEVTDAVEEIIFQKRMEFWGEGVIIYDLKRLAYGIKTGYSGTNVCSNYRFDVAGIAPWWNICLPESETYQNTALIGFTNPDPSNKVDIWRESTSTEE